MIPVVPSTFRHRRRPSLEARLDRVLKNVRAERPDLEVDDELRAFVPRTLKRAPTLHLDDQSGIAVAASARDISVIQDRARLRAQQGDLVLASHAPPPGYEAYCQYQLGLGDIAWLAPSQRRHREQLASHCWSDRRVRRELIRLMRADALRYIHPLMGSRDVWQLAHLLHHASHRPLSVIAPPPALTRWVNDKVEFARLIHRLFGERWLPPTRSCSNLATLSRLVRDLADTQAVIGVKVPDAAGGRGNVVIPADRVRGRSLRAVRDDLKNWLQRTGWRGERHLLVGAWETSVLASPSSQLWIPPAPDLPIVEGVFDQIVAGVEGEFVGTHPSALPKWVQEEVADRSWIVGRLFQQLGYLGRCSFDFVLIGPQPDRSRLEFIECNGRWGGTSLPMTLMNRLLPTGAPRHYVVTALPLHGAGPVGFNDVRALLDDLLFDVRTERGRVVLFNPQRALERNDLNVIVLGQSLADARLFAEEQLTERLLELPHLAA